MSATQFDAASSAAPGISSRHILVASLVGTSVEFYDFYIYATATSLVFGPLFFSTASAQAQLLAAYGTLLIAFLARPVGSVLFGHFGDRIGRKSTLVASLLTMGVSTIAIGLLPTFASIGWFAPLLLSILRFGQGLGLGGEWGGAVLLAIENAPDHKRSRFAMVPQLGAPVGFIAANGMFLLLGLFLAPAEFLDWGWRLPFLASAVLVGVGLWVRLKLAETPVFSAALAKAPPPRVPVGTLLARYPLESLAGILSVISTFALFYLMTVFALGYGTSTLHIDRRDFLGIQLFAILLMAGGIVLSGYMADRTSPRTVMIIACVLTVPVGLLMEPMLTSGSLWQIGILLSMGLGVMGLVYGPLGAQLAGLFPPLVRYTGSSMTFSIGGILGGGVAPLLAKSLADNGRLDMVGISAGWIGRAQPAGLAAVCRP
jgi:MFS family permease